MTVMERTAAEERLLDAALAEVFGRRAVGATGASSARRARWLAAALVLLGVAAVLGALLGRTPIANVPVHEPPVQQPEGSPLPLRVTAQDLVQLEQLPATTQNLAVRFWPVPAPALQRLRAVRRLVIEAVNLDAGAMEVSLAALSVLPALTELELDSNVYWPLEPLRACTRLRSLLLCYRHLGEEEAAALAAISGLRELRMRSVTMKPGFVEALAHVPLERFAAHWCFGFDATAQRAVAAIDTLRSFEFLTAPAAVGRAPLPEALDCDAFAAICALPKLREVVLYASGRWTARELIDVLPARLESLGIGNELSADDVASLRRLGSLRQFASWQGADLNEPVAKLVETLRLRTFEGLACPATVTALSAQSDLEALTLGWRPAMEWSKLKQLPALRRLELHGFVVPGATTEAPTAAELAPLRSCPRLERVRLVGTGLRADEVRAVLGDSVTIEIIDDPRLPR